MLLLMHLVMDVISVHAHLHICDCMAMLNHHTHCMQGRAVKLTDCATLLL